MRDKLSDDGTRKWLLDVGTGNAVETVFIPEDERGTLCVSTQVGCALDCALLFHRQAGFQPQSDRGGNHRPVVVGQPRAGPRSTATNGVISNVVLMGMGEPLANFDNTVTALHLMLDDNAYGLSRRRVTVSHFRPGAGHGPAARGVPGGAGGFAACAERCVARRAGADQPEISVAAN